MEQVIKVGRNGDVENNENSWKLLVFFVQIVIIYIVAGFCLFNPITERGDSNL